MEDDLEPMALDRAAKLAAVRTIIEALDGEPPAGTAALARRLKAGESPSTEASHLDDRWRGLARFLKGNSDDKLHMFSLLVETPHFAETMSRSENRVFFEHVVLPHVEGLVNVDVAATIAQLRTQFEIQLRTTNWDTLARRVARDLGLSELAPSDRRALARWLKQRSSERVERFQLLQRYAPETVPGGAQAPSAIDPVEFASAFGSDLRSLHGRTAELRDRIDQLKQQHARSRT
jgi:hypothetical protein